ncbi:hypothetical protein KY290_033322 [Solanum tuberosum]|uniref:Arabinogalactan peptide 22-like n=1 Tax=Solanum tuberosum TaxID=4113 RepID=A0ABQ7U133_SOLTU|nr:hypothetical protein KY289_032695 [Solanum tuberosum]KAH0649209.1 hypothetical protein KY285_034457 [Solanum tuberosum]KAH0740279.1 hypothetical protein KY290_033322 [Solanum tuberosum]
MTMRSGKLLFSFVVAFALVFSAFFPAVQAQESLAPAPAPASDGTTIDQGIACVLMLLALAVTYLVHAADAPF